MGHDMNHPKGARSLSPWWYLTLLLPFIAAPALYSAGVRMPQERLDTIFLVCGVGFTLLMFLAVWRFIRYRRTQELVAAFALAFLAIGTLTREPVVHVVGFVCVMIVWFAEYRFRKRNRQPHVQSG